MRTRNPCVFLRWAVDGWKVRFIVNAPGSRIAGGEKPEIIADSRASPTGTATRTANGLWITCPVPDKIWASLPQHFIPPDSPPRTWIRFGRRSPLSSRRSSRPSSTTDLDHAAACRAPGRPARPGGAEPPRAHVGAREPARADRVAGRARGGCRLSVSLVLEDRPAEAQIVLPEPVAVAAVRSSARPATSIASIPASPSPIS